MKKALVALLLIIAGFVAHKVVFEISNLRAILRYNSCVDPEINRQLKAHRFGADKSPYELCKDLLNPTTVEKVLLWHPNLWCHYDFFNCQDGP